jgi:pullulanase/glycogen debranching enzyme
MISHLSAAASSFNYAVSDTCSYLHANVKFEMSRVGQNHIYSVHIRYFRQRNHQIYGHMRCTYTVLANPRNVSLPDGGGVTKQRAGVILVNLISVIILVPFFYCDFWQKRVLTRRG